MSPERILDFASCSWELNGALALFRSAFETLRSLQGLINAEFEIFGARIKYCGLYLLQFVAPSLLIESKVYVISQWLENLVGQAPCFLHIDDFLSFYACIAQQTKGIGAAEVKAL